MEDELLAKKQINEANEDDEDSVVEMKSNLKQEILKKIEVE